MKEFMLLIHNRGSHSESMKPEVHEAFLQKCKEHIGVLSVQRKLIAAQPLERAGIQLTGTKGGWKETPFDNNKEIQVGYYHIVANDLEEAIAIAKDNPEFEFSTTARVEIRPIKMKEQSTGFVYPKNN